MIELGILKSKFKIEMADWIFNKNGRATLIYDNDCLRNDHGQVIAWIYNYSFFSLKGKHKGWVEEGIFYDSNNSIIGFLSSYTGHLPSIPDTSGKPGMPGFAGRPGRSGFIGVPGRPGFEGWSTSNFEDYFNE